MNLFRLYSKTIFKILFAVLVAVPLLASAAGLVPCGGCEVREEGSLKCLQEEPPCNICHLVTLANNIIKFLLFTLIMPAGTIAMIMAGILFLTAGANPGNVDKAKKVFRFTITGMVLAFAAWLIVDLVVGNLLADNYITGWSKFPTCELFGVGPKAN